MPLKPTANTEDSVVQGFLVQDQQETCPAAAADPRMTFHPTYPWHVQSVKHSVHPATANKGSPKFGVAYLPNHRCALGRKLGLTLTPLSKSAESLTIPIPSSLPPNIKHETTTPASVIMSHPAGRTLMTADDDVAEGLLNTARLAEIPDARLKVS